jgi:hypothetical protein
MDILFKEISAGSEIGLSDAGLDFEHSKKFSILLNNMVITNSFEEEIFKIENHAKRSFILEIQKFVDSVQNQKIEPFLLASLDLDRELKAKASEVLYRFFPKQIHNIDEKNFDVQISSSISNDERAYIDKEILNLKHTMHNIKKNFSYCFYSQSNTKEYLLNNMYNGFLEHHNPQGYAYSLVNKLCIKYILSENEARALTNDTLTKDVAIFKSAEALTDYVILCKEHSKSFLPGNSAIKNDIDKALNYIAENKIHEKTPDPTALKNLVNRFFMAEMGAPNYILFNKDITRLIEDIRSFNSLPELKIILSQGRG